MSTVESIDGKLADSDELVKNRYSLPPARSSILNTDNAATSEFSLQSHLEHLIK